MSDMREPLRQRPTTAKGGIALTGHPTPINHTPFFMECLVNAVDYPGFDENRGQSRTSGTRFALLLSMEDSLTRWQTIPDPVLLTATLKHHADTLVPQTVSSLVIEEPSYGRCA